jgi:predicted DNA binding CopG/RHH family protein
MMVEKVYPANHGKRWSELDESDLLADSLTVSLQQIAKEYERTEVSIKLKLFSLLAREHGEDTEKVKEACAARKLDFQDYFEYDAQVEEQKRKRKNMQLLVKDVKNGMDPTARSEHYGIEPADYHAFVEKKVKKDVPRFVKGREKVSVQKLERETQDEKDYWKLKVMITEKESELAELRKTMKQKYNSHKRAKWSADKVVAVNDSDARMFPHLTKMKGGDGLYTTT